jgi:LytS/YehU family sensor histidine kinase
MDHIYQQKNNKERETENLKTELSFLRSQVSPHFMFNVLNNLVALARKKSDKMEPALLQLSSLLRYMLYEGNHGKINLSQEINYLQGYIDLQKLRFGDDVKISFDVEGNSDDFKLEPMLLIPFVENAFKHGMGTLVNPSIAIELQIVGNTLIFKVENDLQAVGESKDSNSGIGLANTQRRLDLLYQNHYNLKVTQENERYIVKLILDMHD